MTVIPLAESAAAANVTPAVLDSLLSAQRQRLERILEIHQRFTRIVLAGGGAAEIATTLHDVMGRPIAVLHADGRPIVVVPPDAAGELDLASASEVRHPIRAGDQRRRIAERLRRELDQRLRTVTVSIGVGRRVDDAASLPRSFLEASRAVDVGRWAKGRHVTEVFDELGLERLLSSAPTGELADFVHQAIGPLVDYDRDNQTDLVEALEVWLETRNVAEAARRVHVHYNTFKNRLERIESILGPVLSDAARRLECGVAIYVARHYDGPWATGSRHDLAS